MTLKNGVMRYGSIYLIGGKMELDKIIEELYPYFSYKDIIRIVRRLTGKEISRNKITNVIRKRKKLTKLPIYLRPNRRSLKLPRKRFRYDEMKKLCNEILKKYGKKIEEIGEDDVIFLKAKNLSFPTKKCAYLLSILRINGVAEKFGKHAWKIYLHRLLLFLSKLNE